MAPHVPRDRFAGDELDLAWSSFGAARSCRSAWSCGAGECRPAGARQAHGGRGRAGVAKHGQRGRAQTLGLGREAHADLAAGSGRHRLLAAVSDQIVTGLCAAEQDTGDEQARGTVVGDRQNLLRPGRLLSLGSEPNRARAQLGGRKRIGDRHTRRRRGDGRAAHIRGARRDEARTAATACAGKATLAASAATTAVVAATTAATAGSAVARRVSANPANTERSRGPVHPGRERSHSGNTAGPGAPSRRVGARSAAAGRCIAAGRAGVATIGGRARAPATARDEQQRRERGDPLSELTTDAPPPPKPPD